METAALREKLAAEVAVVMWRDLAPHQARGGLLICDGRCDLVDIAVALAVDDVQQVTRWLEAGLLRRAGPEDAAAFPPNTPLRFLIVQPFVAAQPLVGAEA